MNGWCFAAQRCSSASHSNIGKSVTQSHACFDSSISPSRFASSSRSAPSTREVISHVSAAKRTVVPGSL